MRNADDVAFLKSRAAGRWPEILAGLGGVSSDLLDGKHHGCPKCGGKDRFRLIDAEAGAVFCNGCFSEKNGDGLAAIQWLTGWDFPRVIEEVERFLGGNGAPRTTATISNATGGSSRIATIYDYRDAAGELVFQVVRLEPKSFRQRRPKPGGGWDWSVKGAPVVPYRLPELLAEPERAVFAVEGEKDVENLQRIGLLATCNAGGAGKWTAEHARHLQGRRVYVLPDNDAPGRKHGHLVAATLQGIAAEVRLVELPDLPSKGDVSDWLAAGGTREALIELAKAAPEYGTADTWPELVPFDVNELPEFPVETLPPVLREWVAAESWATQTPMDLAGLLVLSVCSAAIARVVEVEAWPGWREPVNLFVAVLIDPSNRKSAVFKDAERPLREAEADLIEAARPIVAERRSERRQAEARLRKLEKLAAERDDENARREAGCLAIALEAEPVPVLPKLITDDVTPERLAVILSEQGGRVASMSPEGGVFDILAGRYSKNGAPQFVEFLKAYSGDELRVDRVSRDSIRVKGPALTCAYAVQPDVIRGLAGNKAFRGRGLWARFLYAIPRSLIGRREVNPGPVPDGIGDGYYRTVRSLIDAGWALAEEGRVCVLRLDDEALAVLLSWMQEIEADVAEGGRMESVSDWGGKLAGATLRVAAAMHSIECIATGNAIDEAGPISGPTMRAAIEIGRYAIPHAEAVLGMLSIADGSADEDAQYVLRMIQRHAMREFTKRDVHQCGKRRFPRADDVDPSLAELTRRGYIRLRPVESVGPGRPAYPIYEANQVVFDSANRGMRSQYSQNLKPWPQAVNTGNIGDVFDDSAPENAGCGGIEQ